MKLLYDVSLQGNSTSLETLLSDKWFRVHCEGNSKLECKECIEVARVHLLDLPRRIGNKEVSPQPNLFPSPGEGLYVEKGLVVPPLVITSPTSMEDSLKTPPIPKMVPPFPCILLIVVRLYQQYHQIQDPGLRSLIHLEKMFHSPLSSG